MIIIVDLDQTLLNLKGEITQTTINAIKNCKKLGHTIIVNSARSYMRSLDIAKKIDADFVNCFYGNMVVDKNGKVLFSRGINATNMPKLIDEFKNLNSMWMGVECSNCAYGTDEKIAKRFNAEFEPNINEICKNEGYKFVFELSPNKVNDAKKIADNFNLDFKFGREGFFCSLLPKNTNKWNGLKFILSSLKSKEKTIAFGDDVSDIETFKNVDVAVAMENSVPELFDYATEKTTSCDVNGVAKFLNEKLLVNSNKKIK